MAAPDLSEFHALSSPKKGRCKMGQALDSVTDEQLEQLEAALAQDSGIITNAAILRWLELRDVEPPSNPGLTAHRKGRCSCVRG